MQINQRPNPFQCSRDFVKPSSCYLPAPQAERFGAQTIRLTSERHVETGEKLSRERITDLWGNMDIFAKIMEGLGLRVTLNEVKKKVILEGPDEFNQANALRTLFGLRQQPEKRHLSPVPDRPAFITRGKTKNKPRKLWTASLGKHRKLPIVEQQLKRLRTVGLGKESAVNQEYFSSSPFFKTK